MNRQSTTGESSPAKREAADSAESRMGRSFPLGAEVVNGGVNFSVFSKEASLVELLLFGRVEDERPSRIIPLDSTAQRTWHYWHAFVPGLAAGQVYGYRARGPFAPSKGLRFDGEKLLLDPYAKCIAVPPRRSRLAAGMPGDNATTAYRESVIYEMHVGHFTCHPGSGVPQERRGTYAGVIEKIPYLVELGITAV